MAVKRRAFQTDKQAVLPHQFTVDLQIRNFRLRVSYRRFSGSTPIKSYNFMRFILQRVLYFCLDNLFEYLPSVRRGDRASVILPDGFVNDDQREILRVIRRENPTNEETYFPCAICPSSYFCAVPVFRRPGTPRCKPAFRRRPVRRLPAFPAAIRTLFR